MQTGWFDLSFVLIKLDYSCWYQPPQPFSYNIAKLCIHAIQNCIAYVWFDIQSNQIKPAYVLIELE